MSSVKPMKQLKNTAARVRVGGGGVVLVTHNTKMLIYKKKTLSCCPSWSIYVTARVAPCKKAGKKSLIESMCSVLRHASEMNTPALACPRMPMETGSQPFVML